MSLELPKHIVDVINKNETSIGDSPALPPEDESKFLFKLINKEYTDLTDGIESIETVKNELPMLITSCRKNEANSIPALENLCIEVINRIMPIPQDTIDIQANIVNGIDVKQQRLVPEETLDFSFDSIDDMKNLTDEIYKRRMLNALISGASVVISEDIEIYLSNLYKINPDLPSLYNKIMKYNDILLYSEKDTLNQNENTEGGNVDVYIQSQENMVTIEAEGIMFPILFCETIKGLLELAISHGLPEEKEKAEYVLKKSDFKLAENWDVRIGIPLWKRITAMFEKINADVYDVGVNFFFMQLALKHCYEFNEFLQEVFLGTKNGEILLANIVDEIMNNKEQDEFNDYMKSKNDATYQINDNDYFTPDEMIVDSL